MTARNRPAKSAPAPTDGPAAAGAMDRPAGAPAVVVALPWYAKGLRFSCRPDCGNCCAGEGTVHVDIDEIDRIAAGMGLPRHEFSRRYVKRVGEDGLALRDKGPHGDCIFLGDDKRCEVYDHRPVQCRTWPFWPENLTDKSEWDAAGRRCPGINEGRTWTAGEVEEIATQGERGAGTGPQLAAAPVGT